MKRNLIGLGALLVSTSLLAGCGGSPTVSEVRWEFERRFPEARFEPEEHVHLGRFAMGLLHGVAGLAAAHDEDDREGVEIFRQIHSVDFASYKVRNLPDLDRLAADARFERDLKRSGWSRMIRTREATESTWVYVRGDEDSLRSLFVVSLDKDELTLVRVDGRLDKMLAMAMAQHPRKVLDGGHKKHAQETVAAEPSGR
jgi:hypothetical protein